MGLKHNNSKGEIVLASKFNLVKQFFLKNCKNALKNDFHKWFFQKDALIAWKIKLWITLT